MQLTLTDRSWIKFCMQLLKVIHTLIITTVCFITLCTDRYNDQLLPLLRQFFLIPNRINKFMDLKMNCPTPSFNQCCWNLINTWCFVSLQLLSSHLNLRVTGLRHQRLCCMYIHSTFCGCFGNMCTCIYCVLYCWYFVFALFHLCIFYS